MKKLSKQQKEIISHLKGGAYLVYSGGNWILVFKNGMATNVGQRTMDALSKASVIRKSDHSDPSDPRYILAEKK